MHIQVLHNLEADLVVVSIESFYVLSFICQSTGRKDGAISCLDQIEKYMLEQQARDDKLFSDVMNKLGQGKDFVFSEGGATSAIEGNTYANIPIFASSPFGFSYLLPV